MDDIAYDSESERNADPCTSASCMWAKSADGKIYMPYVIASHYGWAYAFDKINTLNLNTPYDYNSVMQYHRYAFSGNNMPTMVPIPNANGEFGTANQMSRNDISRLNTLYKC
ncbi:hypothetical protein OYC64_012898 [Pagothenia borchgrevinki]|uniref:Metalloendopeptidase n=1 Tax=Pagothenia borchgrevinki TaxID=8213 RepID=A0ABD2FRV3_PAGBO